MYKTIPIILPALLFVLLSCRSQPEKTISFYDDGSLRDMKFYDPKTQIGTYRIWYPDGILWKLEQKSWFGPRFEKKLEYYPSGQLKSSETTDSLFNQTFKGWYSNGVQEYENFGPENGIRSRWREDGTLQEQIFLQNGKTLWTRNYDENGELMDGGITEIQALDRKVD